MSGSARAVALVVAGTTLLVFGTSLRALWASAGAPWWTVYALWGAAIVALTAIAFRSSDGER